MIAGQCNRERDLQRGGGAASARRAQPCGESRVGGASGGCWRNHRCGRGHAWSPARSRVSALRRQSPTQGGAVCRGDRTIAANKAPPPVHRRGGILGTLPAAFLGEVEQRLDRPIGSYFELIAGASTGGIVGVALALGRPASEVLSLYEDRGRRSSARIGEASVYFWPGSCGASAGFTETSTTRTRFGMPSGIRDPGPSGTGPPGCPGRPADRSRADPIAGAGMEFGRAVRVHP